jgi:DNA-binding CsgD family transcriptional regulator/tetratricopeptide (TPR) repeat protein
MAGMARSTPLVAREQTLQELWLQVAASASQGMRAALLRGPAGSGKTRVLEAFAERARQAGAAVIAGRAPAVGGYPYAALADALGAYVRSSAPAGGVVRRAGDALVRLVPALAALEGSSGAGVAVGPPDALAVVQAGYRLVRQITERRPLVLVVDDAQLADADTCDALDSLQRHAADLPWTLVLGWRDPAEEVRPAARRLVEALRRERDAAEVLLEPLGVVAAAELIAALLGEGLPAAGLVEMIHRRAAGNPYYMEEMVRWLSATGRLHRLGLQWLATEGSEEELPPSLEEALRSRVAGLPDSARETLGWLAAAGGFADLRLLETVTGLRPMALADGLAALVRAGLVVEQGGRRAWYHVHHPLVGECAYRDMSLAHRRLAHLALGRALAARGEPAGAVASHFVRAAEPGDAEALAATLAAGADAERRIHMAQAVGWYEEALALAPDASSPARLTALDRLSDLAGHAGRFELGLRAVEELLARASADDRVRRATLLRRLATLRVVAGDHVRARQAIEEGLTLVSGGGREAALLLTELAMVAAMRLPIPELLSVAVRGRAAAEASDDASMLPVLQSFEAVALAHAGECHRALDLAVEAGRVAMDANEFVAFGYAAFAAGLANFHLGRIDDVIRSTGTFAQLAEEAGMLWGAAWVLLLLGEAQYFAGDFDGSMQTNLRCEEIARRHGVVDVLPMPLVTTALVLIARGQLSQAQERLDEARRWIDEHRLPLAQGWYGYGLGQLAEAQGRAADAVAAYRGADEVGESRGDLATMAFRSRLPLARVLDGRPEEALAEAQAMADAVAGHDLPLASIGIAAARSAALAACGRVAEAVSVGRQVAASADELGVALVTAQAREALGTALLAAGERAEARDVLLDLHDRLAGLGMPRDVERVRGLLATVGAVPRVASGLAGAGIDGARGVAAAGGAAVGGGRGGDAAGVGGVGFGADRGARGVAARGDALFGATAADPGDGLTPREREVAGLAASGLPSRSIALRLSLSERTVENHLQRIYAKLGLHSRAELIARMAGVAPA